MSRPNCWIATIGNRHKRPPAHRPPEPGNTNVRRRSCPIRAYDPFVPAVGADDPDRHTGDARRHRPSIHGRDRGRVDRRARLGTAGPGHGLITGEVGEPAELHLGAPRDAMFVVDRADHHST